MIGPGLFCELTCVVEEGGANGTVFKDGVYGTDVLKETVFKQRVFKLHRLHLYADEPADRPQTTQANVSPGLKCVCVCVRDSLVVDVLSFSVDLIFQREVEVKVFHSFSIKNLKHKPKQPLK